MVDFIPLQLDTTTTPGVPFLRLAPAANVVKPDRLPTATPSTQGALPLAQNVPQDLGTAAVGNSGAAARENHVHGHGNQGGGAQHAAATTLVAGFMQPGDKTSLASAVQTVANKASTGITLPAELEPGLFSDKAGTVINLFSICAQLGLDSEVIDGSVRLKRRPKLWNPRERSASGVYQRRRSKSRRTAGATGENAATGPNFYPSHLLDNHGSSDHLYPWMIWTGVDFYGFPHQFHRRLRGTSLANTSTIKGFEFGHDVAAGHARIGNRFVWIVSGGCENVTWDDAFHDWAIEINPTAGNQAGASRIRLTSPELATHWTSERKWKARIELIVTGPNSCYAWGEWTIFSSTGAVLRSWEREGELAAAHDWLTTAARLQLRWRVDKDLATRLNSFDGANQGERQGANVLRLHVDNYNYEPIGFREE